MGGGNKLNKKQSIYLMLGFMSWVFIGAGFFKWFGIPSFDKILKMTLGEPTAWTTFSALLITGIFLAFIFLAVPKLSKKTT